MIFQFFTIPYNNYQLIRSLAGFATRRTELCGVHRPHMRCQKPRLSFPDLILFPHYMENQLTDLFPDDVKLQNLKRHRHYFEAQIKTGTQMFPYQKYLPKTAFLEILENSENRPISSTHCPASRGSTKATPPSPSSGWWQRNRPGQTDPMT